MSFACTDVSRSCTYRREAPYTCFSHLACSPNYNFSRRNNAAAESADAIVFRTKFCKFKTKSSRVLAAYKWRTLPVKTSILPGNIIGNIFHKKGCKRSISPLSKVIPFHQVRCAISTYQISGFPMNVFLDKIQINMSRSGLNTGFFQKP